MCRRLEKNQLPPEHIYGRRSEGWLDPCYYCSPWNPLTLKNVVETALSAGIAPVNPTAAGQQRLLAIAYMADSGQWDGALQAFLASDLEPRIAIYDYLFRKLADAGKLASAGRISRALLNAIARQDAAGQFQDRIPLIRYYMSLLPGPGGNPSDGPEYSSGKKS